MKIEIDRDLCLGEQTCVAICPELFKMAGGVAVVKIKKVPENLIDACWNAVKSCPAQAIISKR